MVRPGWTTLRCALNPRILSRSWRSNPLMTLMTMMSTATPSETPSTEINVITETNVLLGRRYRIASSSSNGRRDMCGQAKRRAGGCQRVGPIQCTAQQECCGVLVAVRSLRIVRLLKRPPLPVFPAQKLIRLVRVRELHFRSIPKQFLRRQFLAQLQAQRHIAQEHDLREGSGPIEIRTRGFSAFARLDPFLVMTN